MNRRLALLLAGLALAGCATATGAPPATVPQAVPTDVVVAVETPTADPIPTAPPVKPAARAQHGSVYRLGDSQLLVMDKMAQSKKPYGQSPGTVDIGILLTVVGVADDTSTNPLFFTLQDPTGLTYTIDFFGGQTPTLASTNNLKAGGKMRGWISFEIPKASKVGAGWTLSYQPFGTDGLEVPL